MKTLALFAPTDLALAVVLTLAACVLPVLTETASQAPVPRREQPQVMDQTDEVGKTPHPGLIERRSSRSGAPAAAAENRTLEPRPAAASTGGARQR